MSQPRYLFVPAEVVVAPSPERRVNWRAVQGGNVGVGVAWRLLGGNNHELGRSIPAYESLEAAAAAIAALIADVGSVEQLIAPSQVTSRWGWRLLLNAHPIVASGRWYQREREARYNLEQFLLAAPEAQVATSLGSRSRLRPSGSAERTRTDNMRRDQAGASLPARIAGATT